MRLVHFASAALLSLTAAACQTDAGMAQDLVGIWTWNPRTELPKDKIVETGFPTPDLEAIKLDADGRYMHIRRIPGYETDVAGKPFHVSERWWEWKGTWSVVKGELVMVSGAEADRWGARHDATQGWVTEQNPADDDRTFKVTEVTTAKLNLQTKAIGDVDRTLHRGAAMPERPALTKELR
jgi:hypothetical protein